VLMHMTSRLVGYIVLTGIHDHVLVAWGVSTRLVATNPIVVAYSSVITVGIVLTTDKTVTSKTVWPVI